jgi:NAD(P)-dependent dehydrogenase (short-subunit alcohol dehydrogenase family)
MANVALVTGASRGLGRVISGFLAGGDFDLILTGRDEATLAAAVAGLAKDGARVEGVPGNVADHAHRKRLAEIAGRHGGIDLLVNNASELGQTPLGPLAAYPIDRLDHVFAVNVFAPLALVQELLPLLQKRQGLIVNISSDAALGGYPGWGAYGASKAALDLISLTLAKELKDRGVSVVSVDPGDMRTDMHQSAFTGEDISDRPLPDVTIPFWAWLFSQDHAAINGRRFQAQADSWELGA